MRQLSIPTPLTTSATDPFDARPGGTRQLLSRAAHNVRNAISVVVPPSLEYGELVCAALREVHESVTVRVLCAPEALDVLDSRSGAWHRFARHLRVATGPLQEMVAVDGRTALVRSEGAPPARRMAVVDDPAAVWVVEFLFARAWSAASPRHQPIGSSAEPHYELRSRILQSLGTGDTDDVGARNLGVSLRTYRRHTAEIMRSLGVSSRFQAGVRAAELGLLRVG